MVSYVCSINNTAYSRANPADPSPLTGRMHVAAVPDAALLWHRDLCPPPAFSRGAGFFCFPSENLHPGLPRA